MCKRLGFGFVFQGNLRYFLQDPDCYDQFSVIYDGGDRTAIFKNTTREPVVVEERAVGFLNCPVVLT